MKRLGWTLAACLAIGCGGSTIDDLAPDRDAGADAGRDTGADAGRDADAASKPDLGVDVDAGRDARADAAVDVSTDPAIDRPPDAMPERSADVAVDRPVDVAIDQRGDGGCAVDCASLPNVRPGAPVDCINGRCYVPPGSCMTGFAHCSMRPEDGCEADLSRPTSCGGCGLICYGSYRCALTGGRYTCVIDCSATGDTACFGACVNLSTSQWNCGECGHSCWDDNPHANVSCDQGKCKIDSCTEGYGDCTAEPGCESRLDTPENCGTCGKKACTFANATAPCVTTGCGEPVCNEGFTNCDKTSLDCETPIASASSTCWPRYLGTASLGGAPNQPTASALLADGTHYVGGDFGRQADFDPGPGLDIHTPVGATDAFIAKLGPDGTFVWAKTFGGIDSDAVIALAAGPDGSVIAVGTYIGTVDFDPGPGVDSHTSKFDTPEPFVVKLAADGSFAWVRTFPSLDFGSGTPYAVVVASDGSLYVGGNFEGGIDLDPRPGMGEQEGNANGFLVKLDGAGNFVWGRALGGPNCGGNGVTGLALAGDGSLWATGSSNGICPLDPADPDGSDSLDQRTFVAGFSPSGSYLRSWRIFRDGNFSSIAVGPDDSIYVGAEFHGVIDFDPGPGKAERAPRTSDDGQYYLAGFVTKFRKDGTFGWVMTFPTLIVYSVAATSDGVLAVGPVQPLGTDASTGVGLTKIDSNGASVFTAKMGSMLTAVGTVAAAGSRFVVVGTTDGLADFDPGPGTDVVDRGSVNFASRYSF
jgi:hypothetical protein